MKQITIVPGFEPWQRAARGLLRAEVSPEEIAWQELGADQPALDLFEESESTPAGAVFHVPRAFLLLARCVASHRDATRWALLYRALWRLTHGEPRLLEIATDADTRALEQMEKAVRRDVHKMRAFVRFREVKSAESGSWFVAWIEPEHHIVELNAPFFRDRFANMRWSILTPERCAHWDGAALTFTPGVPRADAPRSDDIEPLWLTYYAHIFNPARVKTRAMQASMPKKYWRNLPETAAIPALLSEAPMRVETMIRKSRAKSGDADEHYDPAPVPPTDDWDAVRDAALGCRACPLWKIGTQTVFGEGRKRAKMMMLGEQPGDQEDLAGKPFIGPSGKLLDRALEEAGIDRGTVYVTNTVKHFKWEPRGKRRLHKKPGAREIAACRPWLEAELRIVKPALLVCLGSTAAQAIFGPAFRVTQDRGRVLESPLAPRVLATVHPSSLLRAPDEETRLREYEKFVADLRAAADALAI